MIIQRLYLIIPKLIEQPTWGGDYIVNYKGWRSHGDLINKKVGQSYELYGKSKLATDIIDSSDQQYGPELELLDRQSVYIGLEELVRENPQKVLGPNVYDRYGKMPLLIKFTQAIGNSFQLHRKPAADSSRWKPKAESWYYFERGRITLGIKKGIEVSSYKACCKRIEKTMLAMSENVRKGSIPLEQARAKTKEIIQKENPWQYVNVLDVPKDALIDLSGGGLHHSWEEDPTSTLGNILYEVQQDVADEDTTVRSFDQGKLKDDGSIRAIHIDDYFRYLDMGDSRNDPEHAFMYPKGTTLLSTPYYSLDLLEISGNQAVSLGTSFQHLFVKEGSLEVLTEGGSVKMSKGHSCFIPFAVQSYELRSVNRAVVLKTYID